MTSILIIALILICTPLYGKIPPPKKQYTDLHVHLACLNEGNNNCYVSQEFRQHRHLGLIHKFKIYMKSMGVTARELEEKGDSIVSQNLSAEIDNSKYIKQAVVLALDGVYDRLGILDPKRTQVRVSNKFILASTKQHPNLLFGASINPFRTDALERLEWAKSNGAILNKWIPCIMGFDPADPRILSFYQKLIELKLPLLSHTGGESSFQSSEDKLCDPMKLEPALKAGVTVIAAHLSTKGKFEGEPGLVRLRRLIKRYPNLYADNSSLTQINKFNHISHSLHLDFSGRVMYGSDWPLISAKAFGLDLVSSRYYQFKISREWKEHIKTLSNVFDRDVALKKALGVTEESFTLANRVFNF